VAPEPVVDAEFTAEDAPASGEAQGAGGGSEPPGHEPVPDVGSGAPAPDVQADTEPERRKPTLLAIAGLALLTLLGGSLFLRSREAPAPVTETASASISYEVHVAQAGDLRYSAGSPADS